MKNITKKKLFIVLFCFIIAFIFLSFTSENSYLYPFNNWVDENAFFTVGKSWFHHVLPYRDLFEQKGPLLYLLFAISSLISNHSFIGVFILEIIAFTIFLYYSSKTIRLFLKDEYCYFILPLVACFTTTSIMFSHGGSAEEFCLPLLAYTIYSILNSFHNNKFTCKELFINGILAGLVAMIKYNLLGFWFAYMLSIFIYLIINKNYKKIFTYSLIFLSGMIIPILIFIIYFALNHALKDFINVYILFNMNNYGNVKDLTIFYKLMYIKHIIEKQLSVDFISFSLIYFGIIYLLLNKTIIKNLYYRIALVLMLGFGLLGVYWGCRDYGYYFLICMPFMIFGLIGLFYEVLTNRKITFKIMSILIILILGFSVSAIDFSHNIEYIKHKKMI